MRGRAHVEVDRRRSNGGRSRYPGNAAHPGRIVDQGDDTELAICETAERRSRLLRKEPYEVDAVRLAFFVASALMLGLLSNRVVRAGSTSIACQVQKARVKAASPADRPAREREYRAACVSKPTASRKRVESLAQRRPYRLRPRPAPVILGSSAPPASDNSLAPIDNKPNATQPSGPKVYRTLEDAIRDGSYGQKILVDGDLYVTGTLRIGRSVTIKGNRASNGNLPVVTGQIIIESGNVNFIDVTLQQSGNAPALTVTGGSVVLANVEVTGFPTWATVNRTDRTPSLSILGGEVKLVGGKVGERALVGIGLSGGTLSVEDATVSGAHVAIYAAGGTLELQRSSLSAGTGTSIFANDTAKLYAAKNTFTASTSLYPVMLSSSVEGYFEDNIFTLQPKPAWLCISRASSGRSILMVRRNVSSDGRVLPPYAVADRCFSN